MGLWKSCPNMVSPTCLYCGGGSYLVGILFALGAAFFYAVAAVMLAPMANFSRLPRDPIAWMMLVAVGVVHTGLVYILPYGAIQKLPTDLIGSLSFIYPIVAIFVDFVAFGHRLQPLQLVGAAGSTLGWSLKPRPLGQTS